MSCNFCNKACIKRDKKYFCDNCADYPKKQRQGNYIMYVFIIYVDIYFILWSQFFCYYKFWLRFEISDCTTSTTCTIFDDEARRILNTSISNLLEKFEGNDEDVPKCVLQLYGKVFIF
jgi:hypothetical protein